LARVTATYIQVSLGLGLFTLLTMTVLFICLVLGRLFAFIHYFLRLGACVLCGLSCITLFSIPTFMFCYVQSKIIDLGPDLRPNIRVEKGNVGGLSIGDLCYVFVIVTLTVLTSIFL